jgi:hypothetical protein
MHEGGPSIARRNLLPVQELKVEAHPKRLSAMQSQSRFVPNLNCKSAAFASSGLVTSLTQLDSQGEALESSTPSLANFVDMPSSRPNQANGHANKQGISYQGYGSHFPERRSFSTIPDCFSSDEAPMTGAFAPPSSNGVDDPFRPLDTFERQHVDPDAKEVTKTLHEPGYQTMDEYMYDANLSQDLNDASVPPYSGSVPLKRDFSRPERSCNQTQWPMMTSAETRALEFEVCLLFRPTTIYFMVHIQAFNDTSPLSWNDFRLDSHANREEASAFHSYSCSCLLELIYSRGLMTIWPTGPNLLPWCPDIRDPPAI